MTLGIGHYIHFASENRVHSPIFTHVLSLKENWINKEQKKRGKTILYWN